jgi:hypothetical protein
MGDGLLKPSPITMSEAPAYAVRTKAAGAADATRALNGEIRGNPQA